MRTPRGSERGRPRHADLRNRQGFTLVELLVVVVIVGLLAGIAQPRLRRALLQARAADAVADLRVVDHAVRSYLLQNHTWPPDGMGATAPAGLEPFLPENFSFSGDGYYLDFENWLSADQDVVGTRIITEELDLALAVEELLGRNGVRGGRRIFVAIR